MITDESIVIYESEKRTARVSRCLARQLREAQFFPLRDW
jgi:hypothetical protein